RTRSPRWSVQPLRLACASVVVVQRPPRTPPPPAQRTVTRRSAVIREKPGNRFEAFIQAAGKKKYVGTFHSRKEAEDEEEDARVTQRKIERGELAPSVDTRRTFGAAARGWFQDLANKGSRSEYPARINMHAMPTFERVP